MLFYKVGQLDDKMTFKNSEMQAQLDRFKEENDFLRN